MDSQSYSTGNTVVLLVDDDDRNLRLLKAILQGLELRLVMASSGAEAVRACLEQDFAVILLDVRMPGMNGFEAATRIRGQERSHRTPIIFVTGSEPGEAQAFRGYAVGAVDYIQKPIVPDILRAKVSVFVELFNNSVALRQQATELMQANKHLGEQLREIERLNRELKVANAELESFSYTASHDLRAPLNAIHNFCQFLQDDYSNLLDEQGRRFLQRISSAADRMGLLIDDLLALSRVTRSGLHVTELNFSKLFLEISQDIVSREPGRQVQVDIASGMKAVGDPTLLRILAENLLGNAWKYTSNQATPRIEVGTTEREGVLAYFVRDNGIGFDMTDAGKLFLPFSRLANAKTFKGTGIGLATVARIVQRHGGSVWAEAERGHGATFYFTL